MLIAAKDAAPDAWVEGGPESLRADLPAHRATVDLGGHTAVVFSDEPIADPDHIHSGSWPSPLGFGLDVDADGRWSIELDRIAYTPLYYSEADGQIEMVSTRPEWIAARRGTDVRLDALVELLLLGSMLRRGTLFEGVSKLKLGESLRSDGRQIERTEGAPLVLAQDTSRWRENAAEVVAGVFRDGLALELSGGVDSRLVLALGMLGGTKPKLAITLGGDEFEDTRIARQITELLDIEHLVLRPPQVEAAQLLKDGREFVARGCFSISATYSSLPSTFRLLDEHRTGQVGGFGGELAIGSFYTPFDVVCEMGLLREWWLRKRLFRSGQTDRPSYFGSNWDERVRALEGRLFEAFDGYGGSWRARSDQYYFQERMSQWVAQVMHASGTYYRCEHPLLACEHLDWGRQLPISARKHGRVLQKKTIYDIDAALGVIPYCGGEVYGDGLLDRIRMRTETARKLAGKVFKRLRRKRNLPDLGRLGAMRALVGLPEVRASIESFLSAHGDDMAPSGAEGLYGSPDHNEHDIGMLLTCAWAHERLGELRGR